MAQSLSIKIRVQALMDRMTIEEKAGQLCQLFELVPHDASVEAQIRSGKLGSILVVRDPSEIARLQAIATAESRLGIPLLFGYDVIHGLRTVFPVPLAMAASWDLDLIEASQAIAAREARAIGLHWTFAPMVDIARDPRWGRIVEGAGEDPFLGSAIAAAQVRGFQGQTLGAPDRVLCGPKHYVAYGAAMGGRDYDEAEVSEQELRNVYFPPFKAAIDAGAGNLMCAYMTLNGVPATGSKWLITDVLRGEWGFQGFTVSDANSAFDLSTHHFAKDTQDAGVRALKAGLDMEMSLNVNRSCFTHLPTALANGAIEEGELNNAVARVLTKKFELGLFDDCPTPPLSVLDDPSHRDAAREAAEASFVLLRNDHDLLPLDRKKISKLAVLGPLADSARDTLGPWIFDFDLDETVTVLAGLKAKLGDATQIDYSPGVSMIPRHHPSFFDLLPNHDPADIVSVDDDAEILHACNIVRAADASILVLGEAQNMCGEAASRSSLELPGRQQELLEAVLATGKPVVVLLMSGRPIDLKGAQPQALMTIWYPGTHGGHAVANVVFGEVAPRGKLPYNWVRNIGQIPLPYARMITHKPDDRDKRYWNDDASPLYPFGFGLTYTQFEYTNIKVLNPKVELGEAVKVRVQLSNIGKRAGTEIAQLYVHQRHGSSARPVRLLKGFALVDMEPLENRVVEFTISAQDMTYWSAATGTYVQDITQFDVWVGGDSTATLSTMFEVTHKEASQ